MDHVSYNTCGLQPMVTRFWQLNSTCIATTHAENEISLACLILWTLHFAKTIHSLYQLTSKGTIIVGSKEYEAAFQGISSSYHIKLVS